MNLVTAFLSLDAPGVFLLCTFAACLFGPGWLAGSRDSTRWADRAREAEARAREAQRLLSQANGQLVARARLHAAPGATNRVRALHDPAGHLPASYPARRADGATR